jgi:endo-1,3-1,4-beta-glycanase ExoK
MSRPRTPRPTHLLGLAMLVTMFADHALGQAAGAPRRGASFFEDFSTFDLSRWFVSNGWNSGDFQDCTYSETHVHPKKGALELKLTDTPSARGPFTCAEIQTHQHYGYGTYEVRMRAAAAVPGMVSAFFTFVRPPHDELDIEFVGKNAREVQVNYFVDGKPQRGRSIALDFDTTAAMNDYAFEWLPDSLRWFANGRLIYEVKKEANAPFPVHPGKIFVSIWNGKAAATEAWLGRFVYPGRPLVVSYEHIAFTEAGKPCHFPASIVCKRENTVKPQ